MKISRAPSQETIVSNTTVLARNSLDHCGCASQTGNWSIYAARIIELQQRANQINPGRGKQVAITVPMLYKCINKHH